MYQVFDTPCFPARWKVGTKPDDDNSTCNYFRTYKEARLEAARRNARLAAVEAKVGMGVGR